MITECRFAQVLLSSTAEVILSKLNWIRSGVSGVEIVLCKPRRSQSTLLNVGEEEWRGRKVLILHEFILVYIGLSWSSFISLLYWELTLQPWHCHIHYLSTTYTQVPISLVGTEIYNCSCLASYSRTCIRFHSSEFSGRGPEMVSASWDVVGDVCWGNFSRGDVCWEHLLEVCFRFFLLQGISGFFSSGEVGYRERVVSYPTLGRVDCTSAKAAFGRSSLPVSMLRST